MPKGRQFDLGVSTEENDTKTYASSHPKQLMLLTTSLKAGIYPNGTEMLQNPQFLPTPHTEPARSCKGPLPTPSHLLPHVTLPCLRIPQVISLRSLLLAGGTCIHPFSLGDHCDGQSQTPFPVDSQTDVCSAPSHPHLLPARFLPFPSPGTPRHCQWEADRSAFSTANFNSILFFWVS